MGRMLYLLGYNTDYVYAGDDLLYLIGFISKSSGGIKRSSANRLYSYLSRQQSFIYLISNDFGRFLKGYYKMVSLIVISFTKKTKLFKR